jgi:hypothetical protein
MPGITIHLAAANEYLKQHPEEDAKDFLLGSIAPDCAPSHAVTHRSTPHFNEGDALTFFAGKINLSECLSDFDINTAYGRGYFFHLLTDDVFYRNTLGKDKERFSQISYAQLKKLLVNDYDVTSNFLKNKYKVVYPDAVVKYDLDISGEPVLMSSDGYCDFIERIASIDLMDEYSRLR